MVFECQRYPYKKEVNEFKYLGFFYRTWIVFIKFIIHSLQLKLLRANRLKLALH